MVKRRDIVNDLIKQGMIVDEGKRNNRHAKIINPFNNKKAPLARHRELAYFTVKALYKGLGLNEPKNLKR